jgi:glycosyltransferase involved in cell wall biosynthesis
MKPRVGVVMTAEPGGGGTFQYALQMIRSLRQAESFEAVVLDYGMPAEILHAVEAPTEPCPELRTDLSPVSLLKGRAAALWPVMARRLRMAFPQDRRRRRLAFRRWFRQRRLNLLVVCDLSPVGFEAGLPFIMPVHDFHHRLSPEFPEVRADGEWRWREYLFGNGCRLARRVLVDSQTSKEDAMRFYGVLAERVSVLPFVPGIPTERPSAAGVEAVRRKYELPPRYFFYPAQLWKHKNHVRLIEAVRRLPEVHLVLVGAPQNAEAEVRAALARCTRAAWHGYVPTEDLPALYCGSEGLVMPTFFGPTNIPIMEAFALGVPVITSDIRGVREQVGDAALGVDPRSVESIAAGMKRLREDRALAGELVRRGRARAADNTEERFTRTLIRTIEEALREPSVDPGGCG